MRKTLGELFVVGVLHVAVFAVGWALSGGLSMGPLPLLFCVGLGIMAVQWLVFIPSTVLKTEKVYDLTGGATYVLATVSLLFSAWLQGEGTLRSAIMGAFVVVWAVRLSGFLFLRIHRTGKDGRFDDIKRNHSAFLVAWSLQGAWVFFAALPVFVVLSTPQHEGIGFWEIFGWAIWTLGFTIEVVADRQKSTFNKDPKNAGCWIDVGLWRFSQHPNYFGEILLWTGLLISGFGVFEGLQWGTVLSPVLITALLTRVSGIPMLDARAIEKWGANPQYVHYRRTTAVLIPWFKRTEV